jgi:hypothetical protein
MTHQDVLQFLHLEHVGAVGLVLISMALFLRVLAEMWRGKR